MSIISNDALNELKDLIIEEIKNDFIDKHLSKNLVNTIYFKKTEEGYDIVIPAEIYNFYKFFKDGSIVPRGTGSYASELDQEGSTIMVYPHKGKRFLLKPGNHVGYVDRAINSALERWLQKYKETIKINKD